MRDRDRIRARVRQSRLLELAEFVADYYLAPIGEVIRSMVPSDLPPWGDQQVWLSNAALMLAPASADEALVIEYLAAKGRAKMSDLIRDVEVAELPRTASGKVQKHLLPG